MEIIQILLIFFPAIVLHEYAHGWTANKLGDPTAKSAGRLTLNPLKHVDLFGTVIVPIVLVFLHSSVFFGWAKPVPVNFSRLNHPKRDMILVALAGPAVNIVMALIASFLLEINSNYEIGELLDLAIFANLLLAIFNMIPIPPLDGSRLVMGLLPDKLADYYWQLESYGILIVVLLMYLGVLRRIILPIVLFCAYHLGVQ